MWLYRLIGRVSSAAATRRMDTASRPSASAMARAASTIRARVSPGPAVRPLLVPDQLGCAVGHAQHDTGAVHRIATPIRCTAMSDPTTPPTLILGACPARLTAGYELAKRGLPVIVLEAEDQVGGIAKTGRAPGRLPLRPRRPPLLHEGRRGRPTSGTSSSARSSSCARGCRASTGVSGSWIIRSRPAMSSASSGLGSSPAAWPRTRGPRRAPARPEETLEQWVTNRFGKRLFEHFFKTYTEKLWGVPTSEVRPSARRSGSRGYRSSSPRRAASSATAATRQEPDRASSITRAWAPARCGRP